MNSAVVISVYKIDDRNTVSSYDDGNNDCNATKRGLIGDTEARLDPEGYDETKLCLSFERSDCLHSITVEPLPDEDLPVSLFSLVKLNFPTLIKCQNCETNFPTKYQYQRHQCDFNSDKAVLKLVEETSSFEDNKENIDKGAYECQVCFKIFANQSNLERHEAGHSNSNDSSICEFCGKHFVSENRLRIHKENHCKKAGDISKFYRSDVTVWKCKKCHEVFPSTQNANHHVPLCQNVGEDTNEHFDKDNIEDDPEFNGYFENGDHTYSRSGDHSESEYIEMISTEILLQCEFCNRTFSDKNLLLMHQRKHTTAKNYECVNCDKVFDSYSLASSHWLKKCSEFANIFYLPKLSYCEYCDRTFKSHEVLYNHKIKKKHYTPKLHIAINVGQTDMHSEFKSAAENKDVINKLIQDVLKTLEVPMASKDSNIVHVIQENSLAGSIPDVQIIKKEPESGNSSSTSNNQHDETPTEDAKGKPNKKRKWHRGTTRNKKYCLTTDEGFKYQCERCIKVFNCISSLEAHRSNEHVATFCCEECGQTLCSAKALLIHCRAHRSLKPYVCDTCGRSYSQTSHLWQHMRFHQGIKPFACPHEGCEARYTIRPDLKDHIRKVHTRERPFKCNVCNKCFLTGSVYYQHRLIHTNDRRYGCEICNKRFFRADALNNHKRIHTDERPYPCNVCGREFRQKGDRNKHVRTQHPGNFNARF